MKDERYNGWKNYETWAVALWIDNEQSSYTHWREQAAEHFKEVTERESQKAISMDQYRDARSALAWELRGAFEGESPLLDQATLYSDLLTAALERVNWYEVAEHLIDETIDNATKE